jgi:hypothetical protein
VAYHVYVSWHNSRLWAFLIVAAALTAPSLFRLADRRITFFRQPSATSREPTPPTPATTVSAAPRGGLLNGADNRWSTSKISILLWTAALLWAFIALLFHYVGTAVPHSVPAAYFALLGIPSAGALGAKAITSQDASKTYLSNPTRDPLAGIAQIFCDDTGSPDLLDSQYFLFNCVLLGYFVASFWHIAAPKHGSTDIPLPALPGSLLALAGVSAATYLGKKRFASVTNAVAPGSSLRVTADSDVRLPGGGEITLASPGSVTIYPGVTYSTQSPATAQTSAGGKLRLTATAELTLAAGAQITTPPGVQIVSKSAATALISNGATAINADGTAAATTAANQTVLQVNGAVALPAGGKLIVTSSEATLSLPPDASVDYAGAGLVSVTGVELDAAVSAGATLGQLKSDSVTFPDGGRYLDPVEPASVQTVGAGTTLALSAGTPGHAAESIVVVDAAQLALPTGTTVMFPAAPTPLKSGVNATAVTRTTVDLPSGGTIIVDASTAGVAAHVPNGAVVEAKGTAATVTADVSS